jgi:hypothetical protein
MATNRIELPDRNTYLRFSPENEKFEDVTFTGFIIRLGFDKLGDISILIKADWQFKDLLMPNITHGQGMPLQVTLKPYDGRTAEELEEPHD